MAALWAGLWQSKNKIDGSREHILCENTKPQLFRTKKECKEWIDKRCGYIKNRKDLRSEPHGWRMPVPVRVKITYDKTRSSKKKGSC